LVASLNRPGGNVTGVSFLAEALVPKRLEMLRHIAPAAAIVGYLINPSSPQIERRIRETEIAARKLGVRLAILRVGNAGEIYAVFGNLSEQGIGALLVDADPLFYSERNLLAERAAVPAIYQVREIVEAGGLMSYGANLGDVFRLVGDYAGRILKGEKPADLPVMQPTKFEFVINLKTAKALGLTVPQTLLVAADEVIE
jgi:putative tryptophan/tyrosine transport system substrate-binding protein